MEAEVFEILDPIGYSIRSGSTLKAIVPIGKSGVTVADVSPAYRRGSYNNGNAPTVGNVTFDIASVPNGIVIDYISKADYVGDDSFEFLMTYSDGTKALRIIDLKIRAKRAGSNCSEKFIEIYLDKNNSSKDMKFTIANPGGNLVPTKVTVSTSEKGFNVEKKVVHHNVANKNNLIEFSDTKNKLTTSVTIVKTPTDNGSSIDAINSILTTFTKIATFNGTEYAIVKFKDYVNKKDNTGSSLEEIFYLMINARAVDERYDNDSNIVVPPFNRPAPPVLSYPDIEYPEAPEREAVEPTPDMVEGDLFNNTKAHVEFNNGNRSIRLGKKVPDGAVNLGYYYNTTASFDDTVSIVETNTNTVTLKYVESWVHKVNLDNNSEENFVNSIEFNGEKDTEFEGYWGILYRDYIMWDEQLYIEQDPETVVVYEEFIGLEENRVPLTKYHEKNGKKGVLDLVHTIFTAIDFKKTEDGTKTPSRWKCVAKYEGLIKSDRKRYDGSAKYSGVVTKKDGMSNIDPEQEKEILMFPDENGMLYDVNGNNLLDDDLFYITDKFKDGTPLYYKHKLKFKIYDSIGKDRYGVHSVDSIKLVSENSLPIIGSKYKYKVITEPTSYPNVYDAYIYTSFVPTLEAPIYAMYDGLPEEAYVGKRSINPLEIKVGIMEKLSVVQAFDTDTYVVNTMQGLTQQSTITVNDYEIIKDERDKIKIQYFVTADNLSTPPIPVDVINKKYALYSEIENFKNDDMIVSQKDINGFMTAKDMLLKYITEDEAKTLNDDTIYKVKFNLSDLTNTMYNKDKLILFTDPDGKGLVYAKTYCDTGLPNDDSDKPKMNRELDPDSIYRSLNGKIYKGYSVKCRNINQIVISSPAESDPLKGWYPKIRYSYFNKVYERIDNSIQLIYSVPEFHTQVFGKHGAPYIDIKDETPRYIGNNTLKVSRTPMYIKTNSLWEPENIKVVKVSPDGRKKILQVKSFNFEHGIIETEDQISDNDKILVDYSYEEQYYHYKGYYENMDKKSKMVRLNLNPSMYSTYVDTKNEVKSEKQAYELFNRTIHFFLRPMRIIDASTGNIENDNSFTIYHKFDNQEAEGPFDLHIGRIFVRHHASLKSTALLDTRSRGGGVIEAMTDELRRELEPDSDYYMDIGALDGKPYQENSVLIIRLDNRILSINGGRYTEDEVREAVQKWSAFGTYHIIEFVDVLYEEDLPQNTMVVNKNIANQIQYNAYFETEVIDI